MAESWETAELEKVLASLPHAYPFRLIDKLIELGDKNGIALKLVGANEPFLCGRFKDGPVMPDLLIAEAMAQLSGLVMNKCRNDGTDTFLAGLGNMEFKRPVYPGDSLMVEVSVIASFETVTKFSGRASVDGRTACEGEVIMAVMENKVGM